MSYGSEDADRGDGAIIADGLTPYSCNWDDEQCIVTGPGPGGSGSGGGGGGSGGGTSCPSGMSPHVQLGCVTGEGGGNPTPPCKTDDQVVNEALEFLMRHSAQARDLVSTLRNLGTEIEITDYRTDPKAGSYSRSENLIRWDPFMAAQGRNQDGNLYTISPIMALLHEIVHASERDDVLGRIENYIMLGTNNIIREINQSIRETSQSPVPQFDDSRNNHEVIAIFYVHSPYRPDVAAGYTHNKPDCLR